GGQYGHGADDCQSLDGHHVKGGQQHHGQGRKNGDGRLVAAEGPFLHGVEADQFAVVGETLDLRRRAFDQHDVAELQLELVEVALHVLVLAVYGEHGDAVTRGEVEVAHRSVAVTRVTPDDGFSEDHVVAADGLEGITTVETQVAAFAQFHDILDLAVQHQAVTAGEQGLGARLGQLAFVTKQLEHLQAATTVEVGLVQGLADHWRVARYQQFGHEGTGQIRTQLA